jgi:sugar-specific transcriptional regulator TrmB
MENILNFLQQLDLSEIEAKLYLTLLKNGPTSVRDLAETIEIKRTTAYFYIDQLVEKGLATKIVQHSKKMVDACSPETLEALVDNKLKTAQTLQNTFPDILRELTTSLPENTEVNEAEIRYYKGKNGVRKIYEEALASKKMRSYVNIAEIVEVFPENFQLFNDAFKNNPELIMYEICEDSPKARDRIGTSRENHLYKILPKEMKFSAQDILIYNDKVAIIHFKDKVNGIVLKNESLNSNFSLLFDFMWKMLPNEKE